MLGPWYVTTDYRRRTAWGAPCADRATSGTVVLDGRSFRCDRDVVPAFQAWEAVRAQFGYRVDGPDTGFYNCRRQQHNPRLPYSTHSWGRALDVNWLTNPAGSKLITDIPPAMRVALLAIRTVSGAKVFMWGADWDMDGHTSDHTYLDAMHWEVVAHPLDLATGIDPKTLPADSLEPEMTLALTSPITKGPAVMRHQLGLLGWEADALPRYGADGGFGTEMQLEVKAFQTGHGLPATGVIDGVTSALILSYLAGGAGVGPAGPPGPQGPPGPMPTKVQISLEGLVIE